MFQICSKMVNLTLWRWPSKASLFPPNNPQNDPRPLYKPWRDTLHRASKTVFTITYTSRCYSEICLLSPFLDQNLDKSKTISGQQLDRIRTKIGHFKTDAGQNFRWYGKYVTKLLKGWTKKVNYFDSFPLDLSFIIPSWSLSTAFHCLFTIR